MLEPERVAPRWILRADPEAGLEMLVQARPPLAPAAVLPILSAQVCTPLPAARLFSLSSVQADGHLLLSQVWLGEFRLRCLCGVYPHR